LARLEPEKQRQAWQEATRKAELESRPVTAKDVTQAINAIFHKQTSNAEDEAEEIEDRTICKHKIWNNKIDSWVCLKTGDVWPWDSDGPCEYDEDEDCSILEYDTEEEENKPHVAHNTGEHEWYTPPEYITAARKVMGEIDLDPASSEIANKIVGSNQFYTKDDDGLEKPWAGNIFLNPPYASELIKQFASKFVYHVEHGDISTAIVLVNNATETIWFRQFIDCSSAVVFPSGRIKFLDPEGNPGAPLQGQAIIYCGPNPHKFLAEFRAFGWGALL
jgi:ParB family chromosome partitioning protein